jgi:Protein of unknown function (DUF664)
VRRAGNWKEHTVSTIDCGAASALLPARDDAEREAAALLASLTSQRDHVLGIIDGLTEDELRRPVLPSGWSCLGLVQHLTISDERFWFRGIVAGQASYVRTSPKDAAAVWRIAPGVPAAAVIDAYRREIELANGVIAATPLDQPPALWPADTWPGWRLADFRAIMLHVITETACHAGHLDAACELIDGRQWLP